MRLRLATRSSRSRLESTRLGERGERKGWNMRSDEVSTGVCTGGEMYKLLINRGDTVVKKKRSSGEMREKCGKGSSSRRAPVKFGSARSGGGRFWGQPPSSRTSLILFSFFWSFYRCDRPEGSKLF